MIQQKIEPKYDSAGIESVASVRQVTKVCKEKGPSSDESLPFSTSSVKRFRMFVGQFLALVVSGDPWPKLA